MDIIERDYARQPLTGEELTRIFASDDTSPFLNTRHATYKERGWASQIPEREELYQAILTEPNLLRRPITRKGAKVVIGFDQEQLRQLIG